jgi:hypothetical protein
VFGWHPAGAPARPSFAGLRVDPVALAFGPGAARVPDPQLKQPPVPLGWEGEFVRPARPAPAGFTEAFAWLRYKEGVVSRVRQRVGVKGAVGNLQFGFPASMAYPWHTFALRASSAFGAFASPPPDADERADDAALRAVPVLALRAARRAVAENPDHPDAYFAVATVLKEPNLPLPEGERVLGQIVALRQCLARLPAPDDYRPGQFGAKPADVARQLAELYLGRAVSEQNVETRKEKVRLFTGYRIDVAPLDALLGHALFVDQKGGGARLMRVPFPMVAQAQMSGQLQRVGGTEPLFLAVDAAYKALGLALAYARVEYAGEPPEKREAILKPLEELHKAVETAQLQANDEYLPLRSRNAKLPDLVQAAVRFGLAGEALELLTKEGGGLDKEYQGNVLYGVSLRLALELALGRVEDLNDNLAELDKLKSLEEFEKAGRGGLFLELKYQAALQSGDYRAAGAAREAAEARVIGAYDKWPPPGPDFPLPLLLQILAPAGRAADAERALRVMLQPPPSVPFNPVVNWRFEQDWIDRWLELTGYLARIMTDHLRRESRFFASRGVLSLLEGDMDAARTRFRQARREPPPGWRLNPIESQEAAVYLLLIEMANKRAPASSPEAPR